MKLTNKQLSIVAQRIATQIATDKKESNEKQIQKLMDAAEKRVAKHPIFKLVETINDGIYSQWIKIYDRFLYEIAWVKNQYSDPSSYGYHYSRVVSNTNNLVEQVCDIVRKDFSVQTPNIKQIEEELVMASIDAADLEALIKTVTAKFK
jgi:hypothetical protein